MASVLEVTVTTIAGKRETLNVDPSSTFGDLKALMREKTGETHFRLGFQGRRRPASETLEGAGVSPGACGIWMVSATPMAPRKQALGRTARGVQNGSVKHAIAAARDELDRTINTRADVIEKKLDETNVNGIATGKDVSAALHILRGGAIERTPGQNDHERVNQIKDQRTRLEIERRDLTLRVRGESEAKKLAARNAMHDAAVLAEGAIQTAFREVGSLRELDEEKKKVLKAVAARKKQLRLHEEGPAPPKKRRRSKAAVTLAASQTDAQPEVDPKVAAMEEQLDAELAAIERGEFER